MPLKQHLVLIGPMGAGKSTIGRILSEQLGCDFVDLDKVIEDRSGASIPWIFDIEGEEGFRDRESSAVEFICTEPCCILATGGGAVLRETNRKMLSNAGQIVLLSTSIEQQLERTGKDKNRPLLQTDNPKAVLTEMAKIRNPIYQALADLEVDTNAKPPRQVAQEIMDFLENSL